MMRTINLTSQLTFYMELPIQASKIRERMLYIYYGYYRHIVIKENQLTTNKALSSR